MKVAPIIFAAGLWVSMAMNAASAAASQWPQTVIAKVAAHRTTPRSAQLRRATGVAEMEVSIDGRGMITGYRLLKSSGVPILDREADMILFRLGSFDAPPGGNPTRLVIPIRW